MRLDIRYRMTFAYSSPIREAHNELRVRPRDLPQQRLLAHRVTTSPATRVMSFTDYWGTTVDHLGLLGEHEDLEIVAEAAVETRDQPDVTEFPVSIVGDDDFRHGYGELLSTSPHVGWDDEIAALARDATAGVSDLPSLVQATVGATRSILTYERASTRIGIPLSELVDGGKGVCQDYAHLNIGLLRSIGVPARYVSGYLFAVDETKADDHAEIISVQTHAWLEAAVGDDQWLAVDPTNDQRVGERHVVIGYGRDYDDVAPVRGVYAGDVTPEVDAEVEMRRMEPIERTMTHRPRRQPRSIPYLRPPSLEEAQQQQQQ